MIQPQVTVIVPCYNEEKRLPQRDFIVFADQTPGYNFLFVNDGSKDRTDETLQALQAERPERFQVLNLEKNEGKAEAVRRGFQHAMGSGVPFLAYWDADLATPLDVLPRFVHEFDARPKIEIVLGARVKLMGRDIQRKMSRHYLGRIFATFASWALDLAVYDTQCGAKMFRVTDTLKEVFEAPFSSRWIFDVEILARYMQKTGFPRAEAEARIYEYPLEVWRDVAGSKVKSGDFLKAVGELTAIYLRYRRHG
jgi:dolichyl-phosphate beta-glucosyltransferase